MTATPAAEAGAARPEDESDHVVGYCPHCGASLDVQAFVQEYWTSNVSVFHCWCQACLFVCDVTPTDRVVTYEPAHD